MKASNKEIFTSNGTIIETKTNSGYIRHAFWPSSPEYMRDCLNRIPVGKKVSITISEHVAMRSREQLAYHFVLMKYLADYSGTTRMEMHDAIMRLKFGTKKINLGKNTIEIRKSLSNESRMSKSDVVELVDYDLQICREMGIIVPTKEQLGYYSYK